MKMCACARARPVGAVPSGAVLAPDVDAIKSQLHTTDGRVRAAALRVLGKLEPTIVAPTNHVAGTIVQLLDGVCYNQITGSPKETPPLKL